MNTLRLPASAEAQAYRAYVAACNRIDEGGRDQVGAWYEEQVAGLVERTDAIIEEVRAGQPVVAEGAGVAAVRHEVLAAA
jgi:hypothetical protein